MQNRQRFNAVACLIFSKMVIMLDRPGMGWRKGKYKGDLPICNTRLVKYALDPRFELFIEETKMELPESLKQVERYVENRSESHGSPRM